MGQLQPENPVARGFFAKKPLVSKWDKGAGLETDCQQGFSFRGPGCCLKMGQFLLAAPGHRDGKALYLKGFREIAPFWHISCYIIYMKTKTLFYCPADEEQLLFEDVYDERLDFVYQPPCELPRICPRCGRLRFKQDCVQVMELYPEGSFALAAGT